MKTLFLSSILIAFGCASTSQTVRSYASVPAPVQSAIDMTVYNPPTLPTDIRSIRIQTYQYPSVAGAAVAPIEQGRAVTTTFNGICLNAAAQATIESDINTTLRIDEINRLTSLGLLGATAIRDISIARNDAAIQRAFFEAQIRDRDDQVNSANQIIRNLENNSGSGVLNVLRTVGWISGGVVLGIAVSGVYVLLTH
jgi:hypothetical protein